MKSRRRGAILMLVVAVMAIVIGLSLAMVRSTLLQRARVRNDQRLAQVEFLLQSGLERAVYLHRQQKSYLAERWEISREELNGSGAAAVQIEVLPQENAIEVTAEFPSGDPRSVKRTERFACSFVEDE